MSEKSLLERLDAIESMAAVRAVTMQYFRYCDDLGPETPFDALGDLFTPDAKWSGKGRYAKAFGGHDGRDAIVAMLKSYALPDPHFAMNAHFLTAEDIAVSGDAATGHWMMIQTSDYADGKSDLRSAKLTLSFARDEGVWRISEFTTENIFSQQTRNWNDGEKISVPDEAAIGEQL